MMLSAKPKAWSETLCEVNYETDSHRIDPDYCCVRVGDLHAPWR